MQIAISEEARGGLLIVYSFKAYEPISYYTLGVGYIDNEMLIRVIGKLRYSGAVVCLLIRANQGLSSSV